MGIVRTAEMQKAEIEEFRRVLLECAGVHRRKKGDEEGGDLRSIKRGEEEEDEDAQKLVCVTSGISFLGLAIVNRLLLRGYSVRIAVDNEEDLEKLRGMEMFDLMRETDSSNNDSNQNNRVWAVMAKVTELQSLCEAFNGCRGVFHTSSFVDAAGVSGYSKYMAELEVRASKNVMEACARTESVKKCVFTSSLLACVWQNGNLDHRPLVLDHNWWSDESFCRDKKLWFALGKTMAEKAAWRVAGNRERDVKLTTICPALITGPNFFRRNPTASIAYLKGAQEMFGKGLLATTDVGRVAEAHVCVYEAMSNTAYGRYICFDRVIGREEAATELATQMGIPADRISSYNPSEFSTRFELSDGKLSRLMSAPPRCFYDSR